MVPQRRGRSIGPVRRRREPCDEGGIGEPARERGARTRTRRPSGRRVRVLLCPL